MVMGTGHSSQILLRSFSSCIREFLSGPVGFDTVSVGGVTVTQQEIGTPDLAAWSGDGVNSGLLGLAYSGLTSVFNTTDPTKASQANHIPYDPFFLTAVNQGVVTNPCQFLPSFT